MLTLWKNLHVQAGGMCAGIGHSPSLPITRNILEAVFDDACMRKKGGIREYRVLDIGASPAPILALIIQFMYNHETLKPKEQLPLVTVTALDVAPLNKGVNLNADPAATKGLKYVQGDAHALPFANNRYHAVILSTTLEYLKNKEKALREARRAMSNDGLLYLILHSAKSKLPDRLRKMAKDEKRVFRLIDKCNEGKADENHVIAEIARTGIYRRFNFSSPVAMLAEYYFSPRKQEAVKQMIAENVFDKHKQLANQIEKGRFKSLNNAKRFLRDGGFKHEKTVIDRDKDGSEFWCITARKIPRA